MYLKYQIKNIYRKIQDFLFPKQKWLTSKIPNSWVDKDHLLEIVLSEALIHYVEGEKCFEVINWDSRPEEQEQAKMIREIYNWYKTWRKELQTKIDDLMDELFGGEDEVLIDVNDFFAKTRNKEKLAELTELENQLYSINTKHMIWLVENRNILWT